MNKKNHLRQAAEALESACIHANEAVITAMQAREEHTRLEMESIVMESVRLRIWDIIHENEEKRVWR